MPSAETGRRSIFAAVLGLAFCLLAAGNAHGSNPRWVIGPPYFTGQPGLPVTWYTRTPYYFTDPGDLSAYVTHAQADALVDTAAATWNVPTADFTLMHGGTLAEHVSSANATLGTSGLALPPDASASNFAAIQIAVLYDSDGSLTDMLFGGGASAPLECPQHGVTESVDAISTGGQIQHAILILNGRCTGPAPEQQLQLQYQLLRAFGRIIGIGWSQLNDNVFTRTPTPTAAQAQHWPIMHPIDIVCGPYTYQCLPNPFTLRDDDVAAITQLYIMGYSPQTGWTGFNQWLPGKIPSYTYAARAFGTVTFPNGQGMQGVNLVATRLPMFSYTLEAWEDVSTISGYEYRGSAPQPILGASSTLSASTGTYDGGYEGHFDFGWIPLMSQQDAWTNIQYTTEPINPLYTGAHSVGPYTTGTVAPSGPPVTHSFVGLVPSPSSGYAYDLSFSMASPAATCIASSATEAAPEIPDATGWWTSALCGYNDTAWLATPALKGHTVTLEVTALDDNGLPTTAKAMPLLGAWSTADATGAMPTQGATPAAFNTIALGTTALQLTPADSAGLRFAIADARGDGRPDYIYRARLLSATQVVPAATTQAGGLITITGSGFRSGMRVLVNGVAATVAATSANTIAAVAPPVSAFRAAPAAPVDITLQDPLTGGIATLPAALTYAPTPGDILAVLSAPSGTVAVDAAAAPAFAVRVLGPDGVTPVTGMPVTFAAAGALTSLAGCTGSPCTVLTDSTGTAAVTATPLAFGSITLTASAAGSTQSVTFTAVSRALSTAQPSLYVAAGASVAWPVSVALAENAQPAAGVPVLWSGLSSSSGPGLGITSSTTLTSSTGAAQAILAVPALAATQVATAQACGWTGAPCATLSAIAVPPSAFTLVLVSGAGQAIASSATFTPVVVQVQDAAGHPVAGAAVIIHQSLDAWQPPCPARGACPTPEPLGTASSATLTADVNGLVSLTPLQTHAQAEVTNLVVTAGTQGFLSLSLTQGP